MLYLLFVLTFLCGILFYGLSPHDKGLDMTAHQAEGMIVTFLAQHQAAKDYLYTWLGADNTATIGNLQEGQGFLKDENHFNFENMSHKNITLDVCENNNGTPGQGGKNACFVSRVVCTHADGTALGAGENCNTAGTKHYVITYGGWQACSPGEGCTYKRPEWWPTKGQKMRRFESWRKAIANRTRGSISCGTLVKVGDDWCIDNGETVYRHENVAHPVCMTQVPSAILGVVAPGANPEDYLEDLLFCVSEFKQGLGNYESGATYFYDGLANVGFGQSKIDKTGFNYSWENLGSFGPATITIDKICDSATCFPVTTSWDPSGGVAGQLDTPIPLPGTYSITILAEIDETGGQFDLFANTGAMARPVFEKEPSCNHGEIEGPCFRVNSSVQSAFFTTYNNHARLISWTIVVEGTQIRIYENAVLRHDDNNGAPVFAWGETFKMRAHNNNGARIYGIRFYNSALKREQIQKNFKVDQKRFGIADVNNGKTEPKSTIVIEYKKT